MSAIRGDGPAQRVGRTSTAGSALEKTLRIMESLTAPGGPHRLAELAYTSGVPKSSTYRILVSLVEQGYAVTDGEGSYGIGLRLRALAAQIAAEKPEGIVELLEFLQKGTGQAVHLALHSGNALTYIRKIESEQPFRTGSRIGMRMPLHCTAIGKSVLAHLPKDQVDAIVEATGLTERTRQTITTRAALDAELERVRRLGYALDDEENETSIRCLGAPVFDRNGNPVGGVSLTTVTFLTTRAELEAYAPALLEAARGVERLLQLG
ncbi:IclR family transcriptional regulator [Streptomyces sp. BI20]|uniref:IclR family transcriptional regulator n=1 Tax=Streptomyces sp. BI20 TaxID=3403460 RepID=UPI003C78C1E1